VGLVEAALEEAGTHSIILHVEERLTPALARLSKEHFDVVLLDLNLPDSKGFETVAAVQRVVPRLPIVIMTGNTDEEFARQAINSGVQDYLMKDDLRPSTLPRTILFAIDRKKIENSLHALERVATAASSSLELNSLIELVLNILKDEMGAQRAALVLSLGNDRIYSKNVGDERGIKDTGYAEQEEELVKQVLTSNKPTISRVEDDGAVSRTVLKVPMRIDGKPRGVIQVDWLCDHATNPRDEYILQAAAEKIAGGIANAQAFESVKTARKLADEERLRLRTIIDNLPIGILITDARGREVESNNYRHRIWGGRIPPTKSVADLCNLKAWWTKTGEPVIECPIVKALRYKVTTLGAEIDIERMDGSKGTILSSSAPIVDRDGNLIGAIGVQEDITGRVKLERELVEAKGRAEFYVDLLTHDIDNYLASVSGYLQLIEGSEQFSDKGTKWLRGAFSSLQETSSLIATVRKVQQSRTMEMKQSAVDLNDILGEVVASAQEKNPEKAIINLQTYDKPVVVGTELLRDLFSNIVGNAIKHAQCTVQVDVTVNPEVVRDRNFIRVEVADNGPGISDELKARLFKKGARGASRLPGRGLGLFLAYNIATGTGGRLWVEDRVPGDHTKGAKFIILLPQAEAD
jgi:signal transduction histidine kinase/CheY-like chemotaxis protein